MDLKELGLVDPETHWYYQAKIVPFKRAFRTYASQAKTVLDIGAGSGFFAKSIVQLERDLTAICIDPNYESEWQECEGKVKYLRATADKSADIYLFVDVLEHVADDLALLTSYTKHAPTGAIVMISVPAFMSLWSPHDVFVKHFRRYRLRQVEKLVLQADLELLKSHYLFGTIFPVAWLVRKLKRNAPPSSDLASVPKLINAVLGFILNLEHRIGINKFAGVSTFVLARVKANAND
jgi:SAM-dependent methyltransferase